jgi:uncharacterized protein (TIGR02466 family)
MNPEIIIPFLSPIWSFDLDINIDRETNAAHQIEKSIEGVKLSNFGGYQSPNIDVKKLFPDVYDCVLKNLKFISKETDMNLQFDTSWLNINQKGDFNIPHVHPQTSISAVLYIKSEPNSGNLLFKNPTLSYLYPLNGNNKLFYQTYWLPPTQGKIYFFPAYLEHSVEPNINKSERISLAMNFISKKEISNV